MDDNDDGSRPPYTFAHLIGMDILCAPDRHLTAASILKSVSDSFKYYRNNENNCQNSIRARLIDNKAFEKREHPKDDPGRGNYWVITPGYEETSKKENLKPHIRNRGLDGFPVV